MPKLSIIIPVYNAEATLKRCLDSILSQSFRDLEVICVDDASNDGSVDILKDYVSRDPRVHASAFQRRLETVLARKLALLDAQGEYIMFVDADDMLLPGACETAVGLIEKTPPRLNCLLRISTRVRWNCMVRTSCTIAL